MKRRKSNQVGLSGEAGKIPPIRYAKGSEVKDALAAL
jgi:hypothetical protein